MTKYRVRLHLWTAPMDRQPPARKTMFVSGFLTHALAKARADDERTSLGTGETATVERYDTKTRRTIKN